MKTKYFPREVCCNVFGDNFYPNKVKPKGKSILFEKIITPGDIGLYKDKPVPYGSCEITVDETVPIGKRFSTLCDYLFKNKSKIENAGGSEICFWIYWHGIQGNMELNPKELQQISSLNVPLCMTYIFINQDELKYK